MNRFRLPPEPDRRMSSNLERTPASDAGSCRFESGRARQLYVFSEKKAKGAEMNIYQKMIKIQNALKVPKNQYNGFGRYSYRSAEDILSAAKPVLEEYQVCLFIEDDLVTVNDQNYIKSTVTAVNAEEPEEKIRSVGYARESQDKKGMDPSQMTGATMSYASKYALGHLLLLDDTKDADATNRHETGGKSGKSGAGKEQQILNDGETTTFEDYKNRLYLNEKLNALYQLGEKKGVSKKRIETTARNDFGKQPDELDESQFGILYRKLSKMPDKATA